MALFCQAGKAPSKLQIKRGATIKVYPIFNERRRESTTRAAAVHVSLIFVAGHVRSTTVATLITEFSSYYPNKALTIFDLSRLTSIVLTFLLAKSQPDSY